MRLIDHKNKKSKKSNQKGHILAFLVGACLIGIAAWVFYDNKIEPEPVAQAGVELSTDLPQYIEGEYKIFAPEEFQQLYETIIYPNTDTLADPPSITGDDVVDERIRTIAESRGYLLRSVPVASIQKADEPRLTVGSDDLLQAKALVAWKELERAATAENIPLKLNSGYRSIESQRQLFLNRLKTTGATNASILAGQSDDAVVSVLRQAALPGYSRHHTGYTVDFVCGNGVQSFKVSTCFEWLKKENYLNAKKFGWIPSYPEGVDDQGPEPEPWEYVWVGQQALWKEADNG
ncbi:M15 family metallopeptidase [Candidatus Saccharibacteria bacterium]|nr:M15 family metallopeptidase [Candidatus Saccharibacteria bacterium]